MIIRVIAWESALSDPNAASRGDPDRSWSPKEGIGEVPAREETATAIPGRYSDELLASLHAQGFKHGVHGVGVEVGLELCEQLAGDRRDVLHARHRQQDSLGTGVEGDLERLGQVLDRGLFVVPSLQGRPENQPIREAELIQPSNRIY